MLVARAHPILAVHIAKIARPVDCENRSLPGGPEIWCREVKKLDCANGTMSDERGAALSNLGLGY